MRVEEVDADLEVAAGGEADALAGWGVVDEHVVTGSLAASS